jgi:hypothetical protein
MRIAERPVSKRRKINPRAQEAACTQGSKPLNVTALLQRTIYTGELVVQVRTETVYHCDDCNRNAGCNKTVFYRGRAGLVIEKTRKKLGHRNTSATGRLEHCHAAIAAQLNQFIKSD